MGHSRVGGIQRRDVLIKIVVLLFFIGISLYYRLAGQDGAELGALPAERLARDVSRSRVVFFAYIGFDAVSTVPKKQKTPRATPIGITPRSSSALFSTSSSARSSRD